MLELDSISFGYPGQSEPLLQNVTCTLGQYPITGVFGGNSSGKSTLASLLVGLLQPEKGIITFNNKEIHAQNNGRLRGSIGLVFQNPALQFIATTVERELAFGLENKGVPPQEIRDRVEDSLHFFGLASMRFFSPQQLSGGEQQLVALASALIMLPEYIILDEPFSMLDQNMKNHLTGYLQRIVNEKGCKIVILGKDRQELELCDYIYIVHTGYITAKDTKQRIMQNKTLLADVGLDTVTFTEFPKVRVPYNEIVNVENLSFSYFYKHEVQHINNVSFNVAVSDITGIIGANGSGKTTLCLLLSGLLEAKQGTIQIKGKPFEKKSRNNPKILRTISYVFQFPEDQFFEDSLYKELSFTAKNWGVDPNEIDKQISFYLNFLNWDLADSKERTPLEIGFGEKRILSILSHLIHQPEVLILDEPFIGLDSKWIRLLFTILSRISKEGTTIFIVTHAIDLITNFADRFLVLDKGLLAYDGTDAAVVKNYFKS